MVRLLVSSTMVLVTPMATFSSPAAWWNARFVHRAVDAVDQEQPAEQQQFREQEQPHAGLGALGVAVNHVPVGPGRSRGQLRSS